MRYALRPDKQPRLTLHWPSQWQSDSIGPNLTEVIVDPSVTMRVRALVPPAAEHTIWIAGVMREGLDPRSTSTELVCEARLSERGWPVMFAHHRVLDENGAAVEERVGVFYRIIHSHGEVTVRLRGGVTWNDRAALLLPVLMGGDVVWPAYDTDMLWTLLGLRFD
jgi:hypothetical protein